MSEDTHLKINIPKSIPPAFSLNVEAQNQHGMVRKYAPKCPDSWCLIQFL